MKNLNKDELLQDAGTLASASFACKNITKKRELLEQAEQLKKIYKELVKWETTTRGY